jgi:hypothetical protein
MFPLHIKAYADYIAGDDEAARAGFHRTLRMAREHGIRWREAQELTNLCSVETRAGNLERALEIGRESLSLARELGSAYVLPYCVVNLGGVASAAGDHEEAARILGAGKAMFDRTGAAIDPGTAIEFDRHVERTKSALGPQFQSAWDAGYGLGDDAAVDAAAAYGA